MTIAICHTDGCGNAEIPLDVTTSWEEPDGTHYVGGVSCGVCGQAITDLDPPLPEPEPEPVPEPEPKS